MSMNTTYPNRLDFSSMKEQLIKLSAPSSINETEAEAQVREGEAEWLSDAINLAGLIVRYSDKVRRGTEGRMNPLILVSPNNPWQITEVVILSGTEGPEMLRVDTEHENTLKGMVMAIEMAAGVTKRKAA